MIVAILGSRKREDRGAVIAAVEALTSGTTVVSGDSPGVEQWAAEAARARGLEVEIIRASLDGARGNFEIGRRIGLRNKIIVNRCDRLIVFPDADFKDSAGRAIKYAEQYKRPWEVL